MPKVQVSYINSSDNEYVFVDLFSADILVLNNAIPDDTDKGRLPLSLFMFTLQLIIKRFEAILAGNEMSTVEDYIERHKSAKKFNQIPGGVHDVTDAETFKNALERGLAVLRLVFSEPILVHSIRWQKTGKLCENIPEVQGKRQYPKSCL